MSAYRWIWVPAVALLAGCGTDEFSDLQDFVKNAGADMRGKIEPPPEVKPYEPFTYDNSGDLPDPFRPRKAAPTRTAHAPNSHGGPPVRDHKEELEDFPLESLRMVGFLYIHKTANAVIAAPDGKLRHVKAGNYMGQNFGQITEISETEVKLKEMVQDSAGDWTERVSTLELAQ